MARQSEVENTEVRDLLFERNVLHISPKPDNHFRLKGRPSGQAKKRRYMPVPASFMARMKKFCAGKAPRDLLFPNDIGETEGHFLRICKRIAKGAGLSYWEEAMLLHLQDCRNQSSMAQPVRRPDRKIPDGGATLVSFPVRLWFPNQIDTLSRRSSVLVQLMRERLKSGPPRWQCWTAN